MNDENLVEQNGQEQNNIDSTDPVEQTEAEKKEEEQISQFTQEQVNDIVRKRVERTKKSYYSRYGVNDLDELDEMIGKSQAYEVMKMHRDNLLQENNSLKEKMAFIDNNINPTRYDDIRAYFKGKELVFNDENLKQELSSHPEWLNVISKKDEAPKTTITTLGVEHSNKVVQETPEEKRRRIFGI